MFKVLLSFSLCFALQAGFIAGAEIIIKKGDKIAFLGDSITDAGAKPGGYCNLLIEALNSKGLEVTAKYAGIGGHKSNQMLARLNRDVLSHKPDWMTLSCGVNDVWHGEHGVELEDYKKNITSIVDQAQAAGVKVIILTATMIKEDPSNAKNRKLKGYNDFLIQLSKDKDCVLVDLNALMQATIKTLEKDERGNTVTTDGVHMNSSGNMMMAKGILEVIGFTKDEIKELEKPWIHIPKTNKVKLFMRFSHAELKTLKAKAKEKGITLKQLLYQSFEPAKVKLLE